MSHTVSRGLHSAGKWEAPATGARETLGKRLHLPVVGHDIGALAAMERFLASARTGALTDGRCSMEALCDFLIARDVVLITVRKNDTDIVLREVEKHLVIVRAIQTAGRIVGQSRERRRLDSFLRCLVGIAQCKNAARVSL